MKILEVVSYFPPAYAFGGPVKETYQISRELIKRGHEVVVYATDVKGFGSPLKLWNSIERLRAYLTCNIGIVGRVWDNL